MTFVLLAGMGWGALAQGAPALMPVPREVSVSNGVATIGGGVRIVWEGRPSSLLERAASRFSARLGAVAGTAGSAAPYVLRVRVGGDRAYLTVREQEHYALTTGATEGRLEADGPAGVIHGFATFLQLVRRTPDGAVIERVHIDDAPRFAWRGLLMDVSRHFASVETVERQLDAMELLKFNVLHWHLSDGTGFRVESRLFPRLQDVGSYGQYYTQDQVRQIVAYAADRGIRVVPEFDVPGHALAMLQAYPELAAQPLPDPKETGENLNNPALDPSNPRTLKFVRALLGEMESLFPDRYIHTGGDEVAPSQWTGNPRITAYMQAHGYADTAALQSAFTAEVEKILSAQGRIMIGWDEVTEAPVPKSVVVEGWRGSKWTASATQAGHPVIVSSGYYLDLLRPSAQHYAMDPLDTKAEGLTPDQVQEAHPKITPLLQAFMQDPDAAPLNAEQRAHVLGAEVTLWTEMVSEEMLDARLWPRAAALAERFWSPESIRDTRDMEQRLPVIMDELEATGLQACQHQVALREALAPGRAEPLKVLTDVTVPVRNYALNHIAAGREGAFLSAPVAIADPDAFAAARFNDMAQRYVGGETALAAPLRAMLEQWVANDAAFVASARGIPAMEEIIPVSHTLARLSWAGLAALTGHGQPGWRVDATRLIAVQDEAFHNSSDFLLSRHRPQPPGGLLVAILPGVKTLVEASR
ncbi:beta-N-acetylhexosaminidase [Gluconobacter morbifer G707]|uniref:beta-N-acetylhexosaminidase n=1 Tax=Gluconobacter morbifer G707 TaxID=1088869 RepID=G6XF88_9PROT|nr:beta-N-acetylhexosaminidase [Gluconobacter morbifer G707]